MWWKKKLRVSVSMLYLNFVHFNQTKDVHFTRQISVVAEIRIKATRNLLVISCDKVFRDEEQAARHVLSLHWTSLMIISAENFIVIWRSPEAEFKLTESLRLFFFGFLFFDVVEKKELCCLWHCVKLVQTFSEIPCGTSGV